MSPQPLGTAGGHPSPRTQPGGPARPPPRPPVPPPRPPGSSFAAAPGPSQRRRRDPAGPNRAATLGAGRITATPPLTANWKLRSALPQGGVWSGASRLEGLSGRDADTRKWCQGCKQAHGGALKGTATPEAGAGAGKGGGQGREGGALRGQGVGDQASQDLPPATQFILQINLPDGSEPAEQLQGTKSKTKIIKSQNAENNLGQLQLKNKVDLFNLKAQK